MSERRRIHSIDPLASVESKLNTTLDHLPEYSPLAISLRKRLERRFSKRIPHVKDAVSV
jgi:hypothetical protein